MRGAIGLAALAGLALGSPAIAAEPQGAENPQLTAALLAPVFNVADPERMVAFYRDCFGMTLATTRRIANGTEYILKFGADPAQPGLIFKTQTGAAQPPAAGNMFSHLVVRVSDMDALVARLRQAGQTPAAIREVAHGYRMMMVTDPEGHRLEVIQAATAKQEPRP